MPNRIKKLRQERRWTQEELALKIGTSSRMIGFFENNERKFSLNAATKLADLFNCSVDYLIMKTDIRNNDVDKAKKYIEIIDGYIKQGGDVSLLNKGIKFLVDINSKK